MLRRAVLKGLAASGLLHGYSRFAKAQDVLKIGICIPMTGAGLMRSVGSFRPRSSFMSSNMAT